MTLPKFNFNSFSLLSLSLKTRKIVIALGLPCLLILALFLTLYLAKRPQGIKKQAAGGSASLLLSPATGNYTVGDEFNINILLNTGDKLVVGVDVSLSFDAEKLQVQTVTPGNLFENQIVFFNEVRDGKILLSLGSFTPFTGGGIYGTIRFLATTAGTAQVIFDQTPNCKVAQEGGSDILGETTGGLYTIVEPATPIPSLTPNNTPTSTPTLTPTAIPTATPVPTLTPTPISTPTSLPTSTPILTPTPTEAPPSPTLTPVLIPTLTPTQILPSPTSMPTITPEPVSLNFKIKFQGVDEDRRTQNVSIQIAGIGFSAQQVTVASDTDGIYLGLYQPGMGITAGVYDILVKGPIHLTKRFDGVSLNLRTNIADWSNVSLLTGDANNDNVINIQDFNLLVQEYMQTDEHLRSDFNLDKKVNIQDFGLLVENYLKKGDQ